MDIGLILVATTQTGDLAALARRAEAVGFDSLWIMAKRRRGLSAWLRSSSAHGFCKDRPANL